MSDTELVEKFTALSPQPAQVARMQVRVLEGHGARPRALWLEWLSLLRARPLVNGALVAAAAAVLWLTTPLGALPGLLHPAPRAELSARQTAAGPIAARGAHRARLRSAR